MLHSITKNDKLISHKDFINCFLISRKTFNTSDESNKALASICTTSVARGAILRGERENGGRRERRGGREGGNSFRDRESPRGRLKAKSNRPNVHAQTERSSSRKSGGAAAYKKGSKKAERF